MEIHGREVVALEFPARGAVLLHVHADLAVSIPSVDVSPELELVRHLLARRLDRAVESIAPRHRLVADLRLSKLDLAIVGLELEDLTGAWLPFPRLAHAETVDDLARLVRAARSSRSR